MAPAASSLLGRPQMHVCPMPVHHARNLTPRGLHATSSRLFCSMGCCFSRWRPSTASRGSARPDSGRREACRRTTPTTDQGLGALCHARLRPAWLRCGPVSFPRAAGRHRGAEINAVITHAGVWHRRRETTPPRKCRLASRMPSVGSRRRRSSRQRATPAKFSST